MRKGDGTALAATVRTSNASHRSLFTRAVHSRIYLRGKAIYSRGRFAIVFLAVDTQDCCCSGATTSPRARLTAFAGVSTLKCAIGGRANPCYGPSTHIVYRCKSRDTRVARLLQLARAEQSTWRAKNS